MYSSTAVYRGRWLASRYGYFIQRKNPWRQLHRRPGREHKSFLILLGFCTSSMFNIFF